MELAILILAGVLVLAGALAYRPIKRWYRKVRRRRGGIYLYRVDHHLNRARRHNGYVGRSNNFYLRDRQHMGRGRFDASGAVITRPRQQASAPSQPWSDLNPVQHKVIKLPWWLCWKWVCEPLETLVMLCTWPVYNDAKNRWNPRRIPKVVAQAQRAGRDAGGYAYRTRVELAHAGRALVLMALALVLAAGTWVVASR
jgi:hypothetical protein